MLLSEAQRRQYWDEGFVVVPGVLAPGYADRLKAKAREIATGEVPAALRKLVTRDVRAVRGELAPADPELGMWKFIHAERLAPEFAAFAETPAILDVAEALIGPDIKSITTMFIYKPPGVPAEHHLHQDGEYMAFGPYDRIVGVWVALDRTTAENGAMVVIPRSHRRGALEHVRPPGDDVNAGILTVKHLDGAEPETVVEMNAGDGLYFHPHLLHRTGPNRTASHRRAVSVHLVSSHCRPHDARAHVFDFQKRYGFRLLRGRSYEGCV